MTGRKMLKMQRSRCSGIEPTLYAWDFDGGWAPGGSAPRGETFSVGVFQWVAAKHGGLKRGKVVARFKGYPNDPSWVYECAREEVKRRERLAWRATFRPYFEFEDQLAKDGDDAD